MMSRAVVVAVRRSQNGGCRAKQAVVVVDWKCRVRDSGVCRRWIGLDCRGSHRVPAESRG
jgi:hypothetical protein